MAIAEVLNRKDGESPNSVQPLSEEGRSLKFDNLHIGRIIISPAVLR